MNSPIAARLSSNVGSHHARSPITDRRQLPEIDPLMAEWRASAPCIFMWVIA